MGAIYGQGQNSVFQKIVTAVSDELDIAAGMKLPVTLGLRAQDFIKEAEMEDLIKALENLLAGKSVLDGFSIHDYRDYRALLKGLNNES